MLKRLAPLLIATALLGCGGDGPVDPPAPVAEVISVVGASARTGLAGLPVDSLVVRVTDSDGTPVAGQPLVWSVVSGGGTITGSAQTDANGVGKASWTLGPVVGTAQTARVFAGMSLSADFTATASLPVGTSVSIVRGNNQTGVVGQALADSLVVAVTLPDGRAAPGVDVGWQLGIAGGSVTPVVSRTGADGRAAVRWTLGSMAGTQTVTVVVAGSTGATFQATAAAGPAVTMTEVSGDEQAGPPGQPLAAPLVVELRDALGNAVPGAAVNWEVLSGGGSVSPAASVTDASGRAQTRWTLGSTGAPGSVRATSAGVAPVTFTSPGSPIPARVSVFSGNGQSAPAGSALPNPLVVRVLNAAGTPLQGVAVRWSVVTGSGVVLDSVVVTDLAGVAEVVWALGPELGTSQVAEARVAGVATPATFTASTTAPSSVIITRVAGDGQTQTVYTQVPASPTVRVTLTDGRPLLGASVAWAAASGGEASPTPTVTDSAGLAWTNWRLGPTAGTQSLAASSLGSSTTFTATAVPLLQVYAGNAQTVALYTVAPDSLVVRAVRADGTPVAGVTIEWVPTTGGPASPQTSVTDAQGLARTTYRVGAVGTHQLVARAPSYGNTQVAFTATAVRPLLYVYSGNNQQSARNTFLADSLVVRAVQTNGEPVAGVTVLWTGSVNSGTPFPAASVTDAQGFARTAFRIDHRGTHQVTATAPNHGSDAVVFTVNEVTPILTLAPDNPTTGKVGIPIPVRVRLTQVDGRPIAGAEIGASGPGTRTPFVAVTDANGYATFQWTLNQAGTYVTTVYSQFYTLAVRQTVTVTN